MAKKVIAAEIVVDGKQAEQSVGSFKKQLKEANQELLTLTEKFGVTSKEATNAAKKVAGLKDVIADAKDLSDGFNPGNKFAALSLAVQGAAQGFAALQGVQALFGTESEELEKTLVKVNAALALSQGVSAIADLQGKFTNLVAVVKNSTAVIKANELATKAAAFTMRLFGVSTETTSVAFKVLKGAIAATGIGLLIVLLGEAVTAFQEFTGAADAAAEAQKKFNDAAVKNADDALKINNRRLDSEEKFAIANAKLAGKSEEEIFKIQQDFQRRRVLLLNSYYQEVNGINEDKGDEAIEKAKALNEQGQLNEINNRIRLRDIQKEQDAKDKADADARRAKAKADDEKEQARRQEIEDFRNKLRVESKEAADAAIEQGLQNATDFDQLQLDTAQAQADARFQISLDLAQKEKQLRDEQLADEKIAAELRFKLLESIGVASNALADVLGKDTAAGKALAVASSLINTYAAIAGQLKAFAGVPIPGYAIAQAVATGLVGFKAVQNILKTKVPGGGGGGGSVSTPSLGSFAPQATTTTLNQQSVNAIGNVAARAYVLETDITGNQERITRLNRAARIN
jgi:hypothetical protein